MSTKDFIEQTFKTWCRETKRNGGVLTGQSLREWHLYLSEKMEEFIKQEAMEFLAFFKLSRLHRTTDLKYWNEYQAQPSTVAQNIKAENLGR